MAYLAIIQGSMECNLGISLMAINMKMMFHYSLGVTTWTDLNLWVSEECTNGRIVESKLSESNEFLN